MTQQQTPMPSASAPDADAAGSAEPAPTRRLWPWWARLGGWVAVLAVIAVIATVIAAHSSVEAAHLKTASPVRPVQALPPAASLRTLWSGTTGGPSGPSVANPQVITTTEHGVQARVAQTGAIRWSYTRTDSRLCSATTTTFTVVAVFAVGARCDDAIGLDVSTGARRWYRNVNLRPDFRFVAGSDSALAMTATGLLSLDAYGGGNRFRYRPPANCRIQDAISGGLGSFAVLRCTPADDAPTTVVVSLDAGTGKLQWTRPLPGVQARLLSAELMVSVAVDGPTQSLQLLARNGSTLRSITGVSFPHLAPGPIPLGAAPAAVPAGAKQVLWTGTTATSVSDTDGTTTWTAPSTAAPDSSDKEVLVAQGANLARLRLDDGAVLGSSAAGPPLAGGQLRRIGPRVAVLRGGTVTVLG